MRALRGGRRRRPASRWAPDGLRAARDGGHRRHGARSGSEADLLATLERLLPRDDRWRHRHGSAGHGADHVLPLLAAPSITIPVVGGRLALGTWQSIALLDTNVDNAIRTVRLTLLEG